ncbi:MAG: YkvA family protein [Ornithinibacter sp.]
MSRNARIASVVAVARAVRMAVRPGGPSIGERAGAVPRMVRATLSGDYVGVSKGRLLMMLAAAGYLVSPLDLIPEAVLPIVGLADDALVLSWLATRLVEETEAFLEWEKATVAAPAGSGGGSAGGASYAGGGGPTDASNGAARPAAAQTVPGDVVR